MGYYVTIDLYEVVIPAANVDQALKAINDLFVGRGDGYAWVNPPEDGGFKDLVSALEEWRYRANKDDSNGNIIVTQFDGEKLGDDEILWKAIAPFVYSGGDITCRGEDGETWRWVFRDGRFKTLSGQVVYKDYEEDEKPKKPPRELSLDKRRLVLDDTEENR